MPSDGKSSHCLWQGELKTTQTCHEMISVPVYKRIWHKIGIDLIGPFLKTDKTPLSSMGYK
jgi:hypothetical protein